MEIRITARSDPVANPIRRNCALDSEFSRARRIGANRRVIERGMLIGREIEIISYAAARSMSSARCCIERILRIISVRSGFFASLISRSRSRGTGSQENRGDRLLFFFFFFFFFFYFLPSRHSCAGVVTSTRKRPYAHSRLITASASASDVSAICAVSCGNANEAF